MRILQFIRQKLKLVAALLTVTGTAGAVPSYCTATYTISSSSVGGIGFFNSQSNSVVGIFDASSTNTNSLAQSVRNGNLYYLDRANNQVHVLDVNTGVDSPRSIINIPGIAVGGTTDSAGFFYVSLNDGSFAQIDTTLTGSQVVTYLNPIVPSGYTLNTKTNGDFAIDKSGQTYAIAEATQVPPGITPGYFLWKLNLATRALTAPVPLRTNATTQWSYDGSTGTSSTVGTVNGLAIDPTTGTFLISSGTGPSTGAPGIYSVNPTTGVTTLQGVSAGLTDLGGCPTLPDKPTLAKSFSPTSAISTTGTTTLTLTLGNSNLAPIFLQANLTDTLPTNMKVAATPALGGTCNVSSNNTDGNIITAAAGSSSITLAAGGRIPAGGCTLKVNVTATGIGTYANIIAANALNTTTGTNTAAAAATYTLQAFPTLTISKISNGGIGTFGFSGTNGFGNQNLTTTSAGKITTGTFQPLSAANTATSITEAVPAGYILTSANCSGMGSGGTATLSGNVLTLNAAATALDSNITCTFTNDKLPTVSLAKIVSGGAGTNTFNFSLIGLNNPTDQTVNVPVSATATAATNGTNIGTVGTAATLNEASATGVGLGNYTTAISCIDSNSATTGNPVLTSATPSITLPASSMKVGAAYVCTYTNTRKSATLTLKKTWTPNSKAGDAITIASTSGFINNTAILNSTATAAGNTATGTGVTVYAGEGGNLAAEVFTNGTAAEYTATLACTGTSGLSGSTLNIGTADTAITCTYTNAYLQADLSITKTGPAYAKPATNVTYTLMVKNETATAAGAHTVTDVLPAGTVYVSSDNSGVYTAATKTVTWTLPSLAGRATKALIVILTTPDVATVTAGTTSLSNTATVKLPNDPVASNDTSSAVSTQLVLTELIKRVRNITADTRDNAGVARFGTTGTGNPKDVLEYCLTFRNLGGADLANYVLKDVVPPNVTALTLVPAYTNQAIHLIRGGTGAAGTDGVTGGTSFDLTAAADNDQGSITVAGGVTTLNVTLDTPLLAGKTGQACFRAIIN